MVKFSTWIRSFALGAVVLGAGYVVALPEAIAQSPVPTPVEPVPATTPSVSDSKRELIYELLEVTGGRQQYEQMQQVMLTQTQQQFVPMFAQALQSSMNLSPEEEQAALETITNNANALIAEFSAAMQAAITYDDMLEQVYYPVYDEYFTEEDLQGLIAFYETPLGEKLIEVSPGLIQSSMQRSSQVFMPRMMEIMGQLVQERLQQAPE